MTVFLWVLTIYHTLSTAALRERNNTLVLEEYQLILAAHNIQRQVVTSSDNAHTFWLRICGQITDAQQILNNTSRPDFSTTAMCQLISKMLSCINDSRHNYSNFHYLNIFTYFNISWTSFYHDEEVNWT
jgi:hypothetical protein